ncbi:hypothetical protein [Paraburkholderia phenoliruptrix]|uniref:hypothetical protein n=1 Tax=Paraburkholderia phenoliruptrix TaxID=252970 RepID=UPI002869B18C|nr:hypothetical protein [Paraburkholderia phenoliruptrix]WMY11004.1 hypothetical protein P3F88_30475 [Paraburkholderia phenoliruptrix]
MTLFHGESHEEWLSMRCLKYFREGNSDRPLLVCLSGGAHLARVFYGDRSSNPEDFLDYWLERSGWGLLALSYPSDHPSMNSVAPDLTIGAWAEWVSVVTSKAVQQTPNRQVVVAMWSMAGRSAAAINIALASHGVDAVGFYALAASPPLPGLNFVTPGGESLLPNGLWGGGVYVHGFLDSLSRQNQLNERTIIDEDKYLVSYRCNTPIMLRGTPQRYSSGPYWNHEEAHDDMKASNFAGFPITANISPTDMSDSKHALCDRTNWGYFNLQKVRVYTQSLDPHEAVWEQIRILSKSINSRLSADVSGGHFFFLGSLGAKATARHIESLFEELRSIRDVFESIFRPGQPGRTIPASGF